MTEFTTSAQIVATFVSVAAFAVGVAVFIIKTLRSTHKPHAKKDPLDDEVDEGMLERVIEIHLNPYSVYDKSGKRNKEEKR